MKYIAIGADVMTSAFVGGKSDGAGSASHHLLRGVAEGALVPLVSTPLMFDYETALKEAEARLAHGLSLDEVDAALAAFASAAVAVDVTFLWRPQMTDPADELLLEAAVNGNAEVIVTNRTRNFALAGQMFDIAVLTPEDFMARIPA